jgi:hypothetical protein
MLRTVEHLCLPEELTGFQYLSWSKSPESAKSEFYVGHQEQLLNDLMHFRPNERARFVRRKLYGMRALDGSDAIKVTRGNLFIGGPMTLPVHYWRTPVQLTR